MKVGLIQKGYFLLLISLAIAVYAAATPFQGMFSGAWFQLGLSGVLVSQREKLPTIDIKSMEEKLGYAILQNKQEREKRLLSLVKEYPNEPVIHTSLYIYLSEIGVPSDHTPEQRLKMSDQLTSVLDKAIKADPENNYYDYVVAELMLDKAMEMINDQDGTLPVQKFKVLDEKEVEAAIKKIQIAESKKHMKLYHIEMEKACSRVLEKSGTPKLEARLEGSWTPTWGSLLRGLREYLAFLGWRFESEGKIKEAKEMYQHIITLGRHMKKSSQSLLVGLISLSIINTGAEGMLHCTDIKSEDYAAIYNEIKENKEEVDNIRARYKMDDPVLWDIPLNLTLDFDKSYIGIFYMGFSASIFISILIFLSCIAWFFWSKVDLKLSFMAYLKATIAALAPMALFLLYLWEAMSIHFNTNGNPEFFDCAYWWIITIISSGVLLCLSLRSSVLQNPKLAEELRKYKGGFLRVLSNGCLIMAIICTLGFVCLCMHNREVRKELEPKVCNFLENEVDYYTKP